MHWPMMLRDYGEALLAANPEISDALLARCLARWFDTRDDGGPARVQDYAYPEPDEAHAAGAQAQARKIAQAQAEASVPVYAFAHGYGPPDDVAARMRIAWQASGGRMWVNRYGYLSDRKLDALGALPR
jgi:hypothetical protein